MRLAFVLSLAVVSAGCLIPRSGVVGMPASRVGVGGAEVGLSTGMIYETSSSSQTQGGVSVSSNGSQIQVPLVEANARIGLADLADLNLHLGAAGIEPGLKLGYTLGALDIAAMPSFGIGVYTASSSSSVTMNGSTSTTDNGGSTYLSVIGGLQLMASHTMGGYAGVKYWYQLAQSSSKTGGSGTSTTDTSITGHNVGFNVGWDFAVGPVQLRPEVHFSVLFGVNSSSNGMTQAANGTTFTVMPIISIAALKKGAAQPVATQQ
jgi:hypothetical protein